MDSNKLKKYAIEFIVDGAFSRECDIKRARREYAMAWGFGRQLEDLAIMSACTELLRKTGLDMKLVREYQEMGYEAVRVTIERIEKRESSRKNTLIFGEGNEQ